MSRLGEIIIRIRKTAGLTQAQLANQSQVSQKAISLYEQDLTTEYLAYVLARIASALRINHNYLITDTGAQDAL